MGVNAVVIVENSHHISLEQFAKGLLDNPWGKRARNPFDDEVIESWTGFEWDDRSYFSWLFTPRYVHLGFEKLHLESGDPDFDCPVQLTFLKTMVIVEEIAGGPVYVGNDVVCKHTPSDCPEEDMEFYLPLELDFIIPNWRKVKRVELDNPQMVF